MMPLLNFLCTLYLNLYHAVSFYETDMLFMKRAFYSIFISILQIFLDGHIYIIVLGLRLFLLHRIRKYTEAPLKSEPLKSVSPRISHYGSCPLLLPGFPQWKEISFQMTITVEGGVNINSANNKIVSNVLCLSLCYNSLSP